jgi:proteasome lid subunit RPN8/RPN11
MYKPEKSICKYLPKIIVGEMKKILSSKNNIGHGFNICSYTKNIKNLNMKNTRAAGKCIGTEYRVELKDCPRYENKIGSFHTHPGTTNLPSFHDIVYLETTRRKFICIGHDKEIRCMSR